MYPDIDDRKTDPLLHYILHGAQEGRDPHPLFRTAYYLSRYPDVADSGVDPLLHYVLYGAAEGRDPHPLFQAGYYLSRYPDVAEAGLNPLLHYILHGADEGRDPHPLFQTTYYLQHNPEAASAGMNPLAHYAVQGAAKRLRTHPCGGFSRSTPSLSPNAPGTTAHPSDPEALVGGVHDFFDAVPPLRHQAVFDAWLEANQDSDTRTRILLEITGQEATSLRTGAHSGKDYAGLLRQFTAVLQEVDVVSFGLFDTLLEKPLEHRDDAFSVLAKEHESTWGFRFDFASERKYAEKRVRRQCNSEEATLAEIYQALQERCRLNDATTEALLEAELRLEAEWSVIRPLGKLLYEYAARAKKRLFVLTDTHLPESLVRSLLAKRGYSGYDELFVSSAIGQTKHTGSLFRTFLQLSSFKPECIVHVGVDRCRDRFIPAQFGIKTFPILSAAENIAAPPREGGVDHWQPNTGMQLCRGLIARTLYTRRGAPARQTPLSPYELGFTLQGPILLAFASFVYHSAKRQRRNSLYFISRDGFFFKAAFDVLSDGMTDAPSSAYLLASRRLCYAANLVDIETVGEVVDRDYYPTSLRSMLQGRLLFDESDLARIEPTVLKKHGFASLDDVVDRNANHNAFTSLAYDLRSTTFRKGADTRKAYAEYLKKAGFRNRSSCIVDIGYGGTIQAALAKLSGANCGGVYLMVRSYAQRLLEQGLEFDAFLSCCDEPSDRLLAHVRILELLFSATHKSVVGFSMGPEGPVPEEASATDPIPADSLCALGEFHRGALDFIIEFKALHGHRSVDYEYEPERVVRPLLDFVEHPPPEFARRFLGFRVEDRFGGEAVDLIAIPPDNDSGRLDSAVERSGWPGAALAALESGPGWRVGRPTDRESGASPPLDRYKNYDVIPCFCDSRWGETLRVRAVQGSTYNVFLSVHTNDSTALAAIESTLAQIYENLRLFVFAQPESKAYIYARTLADADARLRVLAFGEANCVSDVITRFKLKESDWIVLLGERQRLAVDALAEGEAFVVAHPAIEAIYSDTGYLSREGGLTDHDFKPSWSPELLFARNYAGAPFVRVSTIESVGDLPIPYADADIHGFWLSVFEREITPGHLQRLMIREQIPPAHSVEDINRTEAMLTSYLERRLIRGAVYRPEWARERNEKIFDLQFDDEGPSVGIIIPILGTVESLRRCLDSLRTITYRNYAVYIVASNDEDATEAEYALNGTHEVMRFAVPDGVYRHSFMVNRAAQRIKESFLLFLGDDAECVGTDWLSRLMGWIQFPKIGSVGTHLIPAENEVEKGGAAHTLSDGRGASRPVLKPVCAHNPIYSAYAFATRRCGAVTSACMVTPRELFLRLGGFDEKNFGQAYNGFDYGLRLTQRGRSNVLCPDAQLVRHCCTAPTCGVDSSLWLQEAAFAKKYGSFEDPIRNKNLVREAPTFELSTRARVDYSLPPIRVAMVSHNLNLEGAPMVLLEIASALEEKGVARTTILSPLDGPLRTRFEKRGIDVSIIPTPLYTEASDRLEAAAAYTRHLERNYIDVVVANTVLSYWAIRPARYHPALPGIWIIHESEPAFQRLQVYGEQAVAGATEAMACAYRVVFASRETRRIYEEFNYSHNFSLIHYGFDEDFHDREARRYERAEVRRELGVSSGDLLFLLPGTVSERKSQIDLIRAIEHLDGDVMRRLRFAIVGDRPSAYSSQLHQRIRNLPRRVRRRVSVFPETGEIAKFYLAADALVFTSRLESFPRVIQEAMYFGLPIVTTDVFGVKEQVQDETSALFFRPGDVMKLAENITRVVSDKELRDGLGHNARLSLARLPTYDQMGEEYGKLVKEAYVMGRPRQSGER